MGPYRKEYRAHSDVWNVYGNLAGEGEPPVLEDLLASCQTEGIADKVLECLQHHPPLSDQELQERQHGEYREAVQMQVDGLVEDIKSKHLIDQNTVMQHIKDGADLEEYVIDDRLAIQTLLYSNNACEGLHLRRIHHSVPNDFPWNDFAAEAWIKDCEEELASRPEFQALPVSASDEEEDVEEDKEEGGDTGGPTAPEAP